MLGAWPGSSKLRESTKRWSPSLPRPTLTPAKTSSKLPHMDRLLSSGCCLRRALDLGARLAEPGEFTQRAFLSGRLDLTQAEAVRDLIEAQTLTQVRVAASQMGGALSRRVAPVKQSLVELIALLEAGIDFAEDDVDVAPQREIAGRIDALVPPLTALKLHSHAAALFTTALLSPLLADRMPARARSSIDWSSGTAPL